MFSDGFLQGIHIEVKLFGSEDQGLHVLLKHLALGIARSLGNGTNTRANPRVDFNQTFLFENGDGFLDGVRIDPVDLADRPDGGEGVARLQIPRDDRFPSGVEHLLIDRQTGLQLDSER